MISPTNLLRLYPSRPLGYLSIPLLTLIWSVNVALAATDPSTHLSISLSGPPGSPVPVLSWESQPGAIYHLQVRTGFRPETPWVTLEPITAVSNVTVFRGRSIPENSVEFYRLGLPQPDIFRIEPSIGSSSGGTVLFLEGQCLGTNGQARIGGIVIMAATINPGSLYRLVLPPLSEGTYDVEWLEDGKVVAVASKLFSVTGQPTPVGERPYEPPHEPLATPRKVKNGGVVRGSITINNGNRTAEKADVGTVRAGIMQMATARGAEQADVGAVRAGIMQVGRAALRADVGAIRAGIMHVGRALSVQEGKKGLNAVNVKLARLIGGDCDDDDDDGGPTLGGGGGGGSSGDCDDRLMPQTGEFQHECVDLSVAGRGLDFVWARTFRSRTGRTTPMGINWDHSYNLYVELDPAGVAVNDGTGRRDVYFQGSDGLYTRDEFFNEGSISNNAFTLTFPDTGKWRFHPFDGSPQAGKISRIEDRNGNALRFEHDGGGRLVSVIDSLDRTNTITYAGSFVAAVTDFTGRVVTYTYASTSDGTPPGVLSAVTSPAVVGTPNGNDFPGGKRTAYGYSSGFADDRLNRNLTSVTDPLGRIWLQVVYRTNQDPATVAFDTVDYVQRAQYRIKLRRFPQTPSPQNSYAVVKCIVNDALGNVSEYYCDSQNRCVLQLDYTGRANPDLPTTEQQNRPQNKLRVDDPDVYATHYQWNRDSLCTRVTHPLGNITEMIYQRAFNQNSSRSNNGRSHNGDLRILRERSDYIDRDSDDDGVPDSTERTWRATYDSRFGSPDFAQRTSWGFGRGPRQSTSLDGSRWAGSREIKLPDDQSGPVVRLGGLPSPIGNLADKRPKARVESAKIIMDRDSGRSKGFGFVVVATDPIGNSDTYSYNANGNCVRMGHSAIALPTGAVPEMSFEYNAFGQLTACVHAADDEGHGRRDEFHYHDSGPQRGYLSQQIIDVPDLHLTQSLEYDARGNLVRHVDARGFDTLYDYNALDQLVRRQTPKREFGDLVRYATLFTYDANDNLLQIDHENRNQDGLLDAANPFWTGLAQYDSLNRCTLLGHELTHVLQQRGRTNQFYYDGNDNIVGLIKPEAVSGADVNNVVAFHYDERNLPLRVRFAPNSAAATANEFDYDVNGNLKTLRRGVVPGGLSTSVTTFVFDGFDRCVQATDAMGNVDTFGYNLNDNLVHHQRDGQMNDVAGSANNLRYHKWRWTYDSLERCIESRGSFFDIATQQSFGDGATVTTYGYAPNGLLLFMANDNGQVTSFTYDTASRQKSMRDFKANTVVDELDAEGNIITRVTYDRSDITPAVEQAFRTTASYDGLGRMLTVNDNVGNGFRFAYDSRDNCVSEIDANGHETVTVFDGLDRPTDITQYDGEKERGITINTSHVEYQNDRRISQTDGKGNTTQFIYDSLDRIVQSQLADGTRCSLVWSPRSNIRQLTDANGSVIDYTHDLLDRVVRKDIHPGPGVMSTTTFEEFAYDAMSNLILGTNDTSMVDFTYNSLEQIEKAKADCIAAFATYDGLGNRLSLEYPGGRIVRFTYDELNRVSTVSSAPTNGTPFVNLATYFYEGPDRRAGVMRANGVNTRINWNGYLQGGNAPDDFGWRQVARVNHQKAGMVLAQHTLAYDRNQNKRSSVAAPFVPGGAVITAALRYDPLDRLTNSTTLLGGVLERATDYLLDINANRRQVIINGAAENYSQDSALPDPGDAQVDQYTQTPFGTEQHDANGNLVSVITPAGAIYFLYDYADRLIAVQRTVGLAFETVATFNYDVLGRRILKTTYPPGAPPVSVQFLYDPDGDSIIEARQDGDVIVTFILPEVDDEVLVAFTAGGGTGYFHTDDLGNVVALTDEGGRVLEFYRYDDYGFPSFYDDKGALRIGLDGLPTTESAVGNPFLFHGMFWDAETRLYQASGMSVQNPVYQDPKSGRYLTRGNHCWDGTCRSDGRNAYSFGSDSPSSGVGSRLVKTRPSRTFYNGSDSQRMIAPAALKVKEKGNRTKCSSMTISPLYDAASLKVKEKGNRTKMLNHTSGPSGNSGRIIAPAALKVKEKGNRTKSMNWPPLRVKEKGNRTKCSS